MMMGLIDDLNVVIWQKVKTRFLRNVEKSEHGCWLWSGQNNGTYGTFHVLGASKTVYAHRLAFELFVEPILPGYVVMHTCDQPLCVNPSHLRQGTQQENMLDKAAKGRAFYPGMKRPLHGAANPAAKVSPETVEAIRTAYASGTTNYRELAGQFGISKSQAFRIVKGHSWMPPEHEPYQESAP